MNYSPYKKHHPSHSYLPRQRRVSNQRTAKPQQLPPLDNTRALRALNSDAQWSARMPHRGAGGVTPRGEYDNNGAPLLRGSVQEPMRGGMDRGAARVAKAERRRHGRDAAPPAAEVEPPVTADKWFNERWIEHGHAENAGGKRHTPRTRSQAHQMPVPAMPDPRGPPPGAAPAGPDPAMLAAMRSCRPDGAGDARPPAYGL